MNKKLILFLGLWVFAGVSQAQWQTDVQLTNDPSVQVTSYTRCIAASGNYLHVVWTDLRDGNTEIYYKRSTDGGTTWGTELRITNDIGESDYQTVAVSGSLVHIFWEEKRDTNAEIYYKRSSDGGVNWGPDTRLTNSPFFSGYPSASASGSDVHVVWHDTRDLNSEIYYKRSTNGGISWGTDIRLTNNAAISEIPSISSSGLAVHVVWQDTRNVNYVIYYKRSTDGGTSWGSDTRVTYSSFASWSPSVSASSGSSVHVVWRDFRNPNSEIYYNRSTDGGISWDGFDTRLTQTSAVSDRPSIWTAGSNLHLVFENNQNTNPQIYYKCSTNGGTDWSANIPLTSASFYSYRPSVTVSGNVVHSVWSDFRNVNADIYYKRDPTGNPVGITNIGTGIPKEFSLSQNYPNPFNPATTIKFQVPVSAYLSIKLYDQLGRVAVILFEGNQQAGYYQATVDGTNLASGIYYCRITAADYSKVIKMSLIK